MTFKKLFSVALCVLLALTGLRAQEEKLPLDPKVRTGILANGMKYYIRHHNNPPDRADFFIAHNVGALEEEDNQDGLAHFLEHLAFNGLLHYPGNLMMEFLASNGVMFGSNVNAYTAQERTVYNLSNIPVHRESFVDSVLLIIHDWSSYISCEPEQLEAERGVIREEWRRGDDTRVRVANKLEQYEYAGSKHSRRSVIGSIDVINNFKRQELLDFYHKWYRTDLQAVIIVGDIDVDKMETKMRKLFSRIPAVENPSPKVRYEIPHTPQPVIATVTDKDIKYLAIKVMYKQPYPRPEQRALVSDIQHNYLREIYCEMLSHRFSEVDKATPKEEKMFDIVIPVTGELSDCRLTLLMTVMPIEERLEDALKGVFTEMRRVELHGFTQSEFNRAKSIVAKSRRLMPRLPATVTNTDLVHRYIEHFSRGVPYMDPQTRYDLMLRVFDEITLADVNGIVPEMIPESELLVVYVVNENKAAAVPPLQNSEAVIREMSAAVLPSFGGIKDLTGALAMDGIQPQKISSIKKLPYYEAEEWTLPNGTKVVWKQVDNVTSRSEMELYAFSEVGFAKHDDIPAARLMQQSLYHIGVRELNHSKFSAAIAAEAKGNVMFNIQLNNNSTEANIGSSVADFNLAARALHLYFTQPNFSAQAWEEVMKRFRENLSQPPSEIMQVRDSSTIVRYANHPWTQRATLADCDRLTAEKARAMFMKQFGNAADFTFFITGQMPREQVVDIVERYIATLPGGTRAQFPVSTFKPAPGKVDFIRTIQGTATPKASIERKYHGRLDYTPANAMALRYLNNILSVRYNAVIREEKGGSYAITVSESLNSEEGGHYVLSVSFETDPTLVDELLPEVDKALSAITDKGPNSDDFTRARIFLQKKHTEDAVRNAHSAMIAKERLSDAYRSGIDLRANEASLIESITPDDIRQLAGAILHSDAFTFVLIQK